MKRIENIKKISDLSREIVLTLAIAHLGGQKKKILTEEIVMQAFIWNPRDFSWKLKKFKKFPDKYICFNQFHKARTMNLITGAMSVDIHKDGWMLTNNGLKLYDQLKHLFKTKPHASKLGIHEISLLKKQIKSKKLFKAYTKNNNLEITSFDLSEYLDSSPDNIQSIRSNFYKLYLKVNSLDDEKILSFFEHLKKIFPKLLSETEFQKDQKIVNINK